MGAGFEHVLCRFFTPSSHETEHDSHPPQLLHPPCTKINKRTNGPVNAHLCTELIKGTSRQRSGKKSEKDSHSINRGGKKTN